MAIELSREQIAATFFQDIVAQRNCEKPFVETLSAADIEQSRFAEEADKLWLIAHTIVKMIDSVEGKPTRSLE
jgi:hypothetical protein